MATGKASVYEISCLLVLPFLYIAILNKSYAVAEMGDRLATMDMGRKLGAAVLLSGGWISI